MLHRYLNAWHRVEATGQELANALAETPPAGGGGGEPPRNPGNGGEEPPAGAAPAPGEGTPQPKGATINLEDLSQALSTSMTKSLQDVFGGRKDQTQQTRRQTVREMVQALTPEQRAELESRIAANPVGSTIDLAELMAAEQIDAFTRQAQPFMETTGHLYVDNFITQKSNTDPYFKQVAPLFRDQLNDMDMRALLQLPQDARQRQLNLRWDAAMAAATRKAGGRMEVRHDPPPIGGSSQSGGGGGGGKRERGTVAVGRVFADPALDRDEGLTAIVANMKRRGTITDADIAEIEETYQDVAY